MPKRRANHEGTISKRKDGRWEARITLPNGQRKLYYGRTREEVREKLTKGLKSVQDRLPIPGDRLKVGMFLQEWLQMAEHSIRPSTWRRYEQLIRVHAAPAIGNLPLSHPEPRHLQKLYADCLGGGSAPATVRQLHAVIRRALGQADRWGMVARNVATLVTPPRIIRHEIHPLSADQARVLLSAARGQRFEALYVLALTTGMRLGEILALCWRDVDLDAGQLQVRHTLLRLKDGLKLREPKTSQSRRRIIALTHSAMEALRHHRRRQVEERLQPGRARDDQDLVFCNEIGRPIEHGNLMRSSFWPLLEKANLPRIRFHDIRTFVRDPSPSTRRTRQNRERDARALQYQDHSRYL